MTILCHDMTICFFRGIYVVPEQHFRNVIQACHPFGRIFVSNKKNEVSRVMVFPGFVYFCIA